MGSTIPGYSNQHLRAPTGVPRRRFVIGAGSQSLMSCTNDGMSQVPTTGSWWIETGRAVGKDFIGTSPYVGRVCGMPGEKTRTGAIKFQYLGRQRSRLGLDIV